MTDHRPPHPVDAEWELHDDSEPMSAANLSGPTAERGADTIQLWLTACAILAAAGLAVWSVARTLTIYLGG